MSRHSVEVDTTADVNLEIEINGADVKNFLEKMLDDVPKKAWEWITDSFDEDDYISEWREFEDVDVTVEITSDDVGEMITDAIGEEKEEWIKIEWTNEIKLNTFEDELKFDLFIKAFQKYSLSELTDLLKV